MPNLGSLWYQVMLKDMTDADLQKINAKLKNLGVTIDTSKIRQSIEASVGATPFNATVTFGNARASIDAALAGTKQITVEAIASKLHESINAALAKYAGNALIVPKKKELRKAVNDALLSSGFEINIGKVKGLATTINNALGSDHSIKISVDSRKLADAIDKAVKSYKGGTQIPLEAKEKILQDSIRKALRSEKFPIKVIVDKAEAQDAVRQALQAAGLQNRTGFTASDKRAWDAQSRRMEAEARAAAASALAQRRLAGAHRSAQRAVDSHIHSSISLGSAMRGNIRIAGELGPMLASAYSVVALKNFMQKVVEIGGELEKQKLAMNAILGDEGFANTISSQINTLAVKSPFGIMELNQYAKQLTAFQIPYNELYDTMKRMADVSAAVGVDMGRIILAYGQVRAAKFLKGTELRQFTEANIPLIDMLADRFTKLKGEIVSAGDIMDMISNKEVSFEDVKAVLWELTGEGGRFYNMQEVLSESVQAKWKNLADAIDLMFADIAESVSGPLKTTAEILTELTSKWELIATTVAAAALAFGGAKAVLLLFNRGLSNTTANAIKTAESQALLERRNLRLAQSYRSLTAAEQAALATPTKSVFGGLNLTGSLSRIKNFTDEQTKQLILSKQISKEEWMRLAAMGKLTQRQKAALVVYGGISREELRSIRNLKGMQLLWAKIRYIAASVGRAIAGFVFNPATLVTTGIAALTALWKKNNEEMQRAKEFGKELETQGSEASRNLAESLKTIPKAATGAEAAQTLEKLQQLVKDYSSIPDRVLDLSQFKDDGTIRTTAEQIEYLRGELEKLKAANDALSEKGEEYGAVVKATDGGWFDEDVITDINDWANAVDSAKGAYLKFVTERKKDAETIVATAAKEDAAYRESIKGMDNLVDKFSELMNNSEKYSKGFNAAIEGNRWKLGGGFKGFIGISDGVLQSSMKQVADYSEMIAEIQESVNAFKGLHSDWDWGNLDSTQEEIIRKYFNGLIQKAEDAGPEAQKQLQTIISNMLGFDISGMSGELMIANEMRDQLPQLLGKELADKVVNGLKLTDDEQNKVNKAIQDTYFKMFANADDLGKKALTKAVSKDGKVIDLTKLAGIRARFDVTADWDSWKRELNQKYGGDPTVQAWVKGAPDYLSFIKAVQDGYKEAQTAIDNLKPVLIKAKLGFDFQMGDLLPEGTPSTWYMGLSETQKKNVQDYNKFIRAVKSAQKVGKEEGFDPAAEYNKGHKGSKGSKRDEFAEAVKERINLLKKAKSEYESLAKQIGRESASKQLADSPIFAGLKANKFLPEQSIPKTLDDYEKELDRLQELLSAKGLKTKKRRELNVEIEQVKFVINKKKTEEALKLALDEVTQEAERQLENWNLYDKIRKATGNKQLAMNLAFGINTEGQTDYVAMIKEHFNAIAKAYSSTYTYDTATPELLQKEGIEEVQKAYKKANGDILKYYDQQRVEAADLYNEYQTLADKITAINGKRQRALDALNGQHKDENGNMVDNVPDPNERNRMTALINSSADWEIYRQGEDYLKFFSQIYSLALTDVRRIGNTIKLYLNEQFQQGKLNIKEYADELRKVEEQLRKAEHPRSDFMLGITSGKKGILDRRIEKEEGGVIGSTEYKQAINAQIAAHVRLDNLKKAGVKESSEEYKKAAAIADETDKTVSNLTAGVDRLRDQKAQLEDLESIFAYINKQSQGLGDVFSDIKTISGAMGINTDTDGFDSAEYLVNTMMAVSNGLQKFNEAYNNEDYAGMAAAVSSIAAAATSGDEEKHDRKLSRKIKEANADFKEMQGIIDGINRRMEHFLGHGKGVMTDDIQKDIKALKTLKKGTEEYERTLKRVNAYNEGGAYAYQRQLMKEQYDSLRKQYDLESKKKDKDKEAMQDYQSQMAELQDQMRYFAEETAKDLYGIDLKGWAQELGDAMYDAWKRGEDGAEAFKKKASEIVGTVLNNIFRLKVLEPMMQKLADDLFGKDGEGGIFGKDFELTSDEVINYVVDSLMNIGDSWNDYAKFMDEANDRYMEKTGESLKDEESKSGLSAGIQSVTEDTADLLASYLNAIRADVSEQTHVLWPRLLDDVLPQMNVIAESQLRVQTQIAENTMRNALAAEAIVRSNDEIKKSNDEINRLLARVTQGGAKFYIH